MRFLPLFLLACTPAAEVDPALELPGDVVAGEPLWLGECGLCHGLDGEGTSRGGPLIGIFERQTEAEVLLTVRMGVSSMPPYDDFYSDQELADLLAWMRASL